MSTTKDTHSGGFGKFIDDCQAINRRINAVGAAARQVPEVVNGLLFLLSSLCAMWVRLLLRGRMGGLVLFYFGVPSIMLLSTVGTILHVRAAGQIVKWWANILVIALLCHIVGAVRRRFRPNAPMVVRGSLGEPLPLFQRLWQFTMRSWGLDLAKISLIGEPILCLAIGGACWSIERLATDAQPILCWVVFASGLGCFIQSAIIVERDARQVRMMIAQEQRQLHLAELLDLKTRQSHGRQPEGFAQYPE